MARKRRMSAKQRRYFAPRRARRTRAVRSSAPRRRSKGGFGKVTSGWLPMNGTEIVTAGLAGAITQPLSAWLKPHQDKYLGALGNYSDEAALAIVGAATYKFAPPGMIKNIGKEIFHVAVLNAGGQLGADVLGNGTTSSSTASAGYL